jgi:hypothetical protein
MKDKPIIKERESTFSEEKAFLRGEFFTARWPEMDFVPGAF